MDIFLFCFIHFVFNADFFLLHRHTWKMSLCGFCFCLCCIFLQIIKKLLVLIFLNAIKYYFFVKCYSMKKASRIIFNCQKNIVKSPWWHSIIFFFTSLSNTILASCFIVTQKKYNIAFLIICRLFCILP